MISGAKRHSDRLKRMQQATRAITQALYAAGQEIEITAELSITAGSVSGAGHVPSAPGQPPNADTGVLDGNIETEIVASGANPTVTVTSKAPYAAALEFGTSKMAARPYMRPAVAKYRDDVARRVGQAVKISIR